MSEFEIQPSPNDMVFSVIRSALGLIGRRALLLLSLLASMGLYAFAAEYPTPERIGVSVLFTATVFLPLLYASLRS